MTGITETHRINKGESAGFLFLTLIGLAMTATSFGYGIFLDGMRIGPGFLPLVIGGLLALMGGVQLVAGLVKSRRNPDQATAPGARSGTTQDDEKRDANGRTQKYRIRQLWTVFTALLVALLLIPWIGFLAAFGLLAVFISTVVEKRSLLSAAAITIVSLGSVYLVFVQLLKIPLPTGSLIHMLGG